MDFSKPIRFADPISTALEISTCHLDYENHRHIHFVSSGTTADLSRFTLADLEGEDESEDNTNFESVLDPEEEIYETESNSNRLLNFHVAKLLIVVLVLRSVFLIFFG